LNEATEISKICTVCSAFSILDRKCADGIEMMKSGREKTATERLLMMQGENAAQ